MFSSIHRLLLLFCCILPFVQSGDKEKKKRYMFIHTVDDDKYETLLLLVKGKFHVPVAERTRSQKSAVVQFWRRKELFTLGNEESPTYTIFQRKEGSQKVGGFRTCCKNI